jgi:hypothetical protein
MMALTGPPGAFSEKAFFTARAAAGHWDVSTIMFPASV